MLFVIIWLANKEPSDIKREVTTTQVTANILNAMLKTTTDCRDMRASDLALNCIKTSFNADTIKNCQNGQNSCEYFESFTASILNNTIYEWGNDYNFYIEYDSTQYLQSSTGNCASDNVRKETETSPYPLYPLQGAIEVVLQVCN